MLCDWYFCRCLDADEDRTAATLSILNVLGDQSVTSESIGLAIEELSRSDIWTRRFALPRLIIALRRRDIARRRRELAYQMIAEAVIGRGSSQQWSALAGYLTDGMESRDFLQTIEQCAEELERADSTKALHVPYLDLPVTGPAVVLLSAVQGDSSDSVKELISATTRTSFGRVVESAMKHCHGRLAFLLAARLRVDHGQGITGAGILAAIADAPGSILSLEPDLLDLAALAWNVGRNATETAVTGAGYRQLVPPGRNEETLKDTKRTVLRRLGFNFTRPEQIEVCERSYGK